MPIFRLIQKKTGVVVIEVRPQLPDENIKERILYELMRRWGLKLEEHAAESEVGQEI